MLNWSIGKQRLHVDKGAARHGPKTTERTTIVTKRGDSTALQQIQRMVESPLSREKRSSSELDLLSVPPETIGTALDTEDGFKDFVRRLQDGLRVELSKRLKERKPVTPNLLGSCEKGRLDVLLKKRGGGK